MGKGIPAALLLTLALGAPAPLPAVGFLYGGESGLPVGGFEREFGQARLPVRDLPKRKGTS